MQKSVNYDYSFYIQIIQKISNVVQSLGCQYFLFLNQTLQIENKYKTFNDRILNKLNAFRMNFNSYSYFPNLFARYTLSSCSNCAMILVALPSRILHNSISSRCFSSNNKNSCSFLQIETQTYSEWIFFSQNKTQCQCQCYVTYFCVKSSICLSARSAIARSFCLVSFRIDVSISSNCFWYSATFVRTKSSSCVW